MRTTGVPALQRFGREQSAVAGGTGDEDIHMANMVLALDIPRTSRLWVNAFSYHRTSSGSGPLVRSFSMSAPGSDSTHRKRVARGFCVLIFLGMRLGDALLWWYLSLPGNAAPLMNGAIVGSALCTTALLVGIWRRVSWCRYALVTLTWCFMALCSFPALRGLGGRQVMTHQEYALILGAVLLYAGGTVLLVRSRRIRHLATVPMIGH